MGSSSWELGGFETCAAGDDQIWGCGQSCAISLPQMTRSVHCSAPGALACAARGSFQRVRAGSFAAGANRGGASAWKRPVPAVRQGAPRGNPPEIPNSIHNSHSLSPATAHGCRNSSLTAGAGLLHSVVAPFMRARDINDGQPC